MRFMDLHLRFLELTNTYGPRMRIKDARQTFLGIWIRNLLQGKPIQVFGDGKQGGTTILSTMLSMPFLSATSDDAVGKHLT